MLTRIRKSLNEKDSGFTLIELLVVIIIIGILAAIAIPVFLNQRKKGVDASMKSDAKTIATQMETAFTNNQAYPTPNFSTAGQVTVGTEVVYLSPGNTGTLTFNTASSAFCVNVVRVSGAPESSSTTGFFYISSKGGLQPSSVTACPAPAAF